MLRALAKELALQLGKKLVWGNVGFAGKVRLGREGESRTNGELRCFREYFSQI